MELYVGAGILILLVWVLDSLRRIRHGLAVLEDRQAQLARHLGLMAPAGSQPSDKVRALAADRRTYVEAIRTYREETGSDLRTARSIVDAQAAGRR